MVLELFAVGVAGGLVKTLLNHGGALILPEKITVNGRTYISLGAVSDLVIGGIMGYLASDPHFLGLVGLPQTPSPGLAFFLSFGSAVILEGMINRIREPMEKFKNNSFLRKRDDFGPKLDEKGPKNNNSGRLNPIVYY